jgi:putative ABC transport system substrate-binding protein
LFGEHVPYGIAVVLAAVLTPTFTEFPMVRCYRSHRFAQERSRLESGMDAIGKFAREPKGGLIVVPPGLVGAERDMVFRQTLQRRLPAIYQAKVYALDGGLMSYGADAADLFRQSSTLVDRILRGARPRELPVQVPTKFELVINLKAEKAIGLEIRPLLHSRADEVIE